MLKDYQKKILELLEQLELEMAGLYKLFANKFSSRGDLWIALAQEETGHADKVKKLRSFIDEGKAAFDEKMTKTYTVQLFIDNIKKVYTDAQTNNMPLLKALALSYDFEQSIIEKKLYDYFISSDSDVKIIINDIREDTSNHSSKIKKIMEEEKQGMGKPVWQALR